MRINVLNGLRGCAALLVVLSHMPQISSTELGRSLYIVIDNFNFGYLGVDLFFVLSGFLITRILLRDRKNGNFSFKLFYIKRALRIFPIYFLTILICGLVFSWEGMEYLGGYLANYYFTFTGTGHPLENVWSLSVEEHFYLIWPPIVYFFHLKSVQNYSWVVAIGIALLSLVLVYEIFDDDISSRLIYMGTEFRMLSLCLGSTMAFYEQRIWALNKTKSTYWLFSLSALLFLFAFFTHAPIVRESFLIPLSAVQLFLFAGCSTSMFLLVLIQEGRMNSIDAVFGNKFIGYIGRISYGLYLYHFPLFYGWGITKNQLDGEPIAFVEFLVPLLVSFIVAGLSYRFIEKPILHYKTKLTLKLQRRIREF